MVGGYGDNKLAKPQNAQLTLTFGSMCGGPRQGALFLISFVARIPLFLLRSSRGYAHNGLEAHRADEQRAHQRLDFLLAATLRPASSCKASGSRHQHNRLRARGRPRAVFVPRCRAQARPRTCRPSAHQRRQPAGLHVTSKKARCTTFLPQSTFELVRSSLGISGPSLGILGVPPLANQR